MSISDPHPDYITKQSTWKRNRDVYEGEKKVKAGKTIYLPKLGYHASSTTGGQEAYDTFLNYATFFDATYRTVTAMAGLVFRKAIMVAGKNTEKYKDDFTDDNRTMTTAAQECVTEILLQNRVGLLVSFPDVDTSDMSKKQYEEEKIHAYSAIYKTEDIINWRVANRKGEKVPVLVVLREQVEDPYRTDIFDTSTVTQYRVLQLDDAGFYKESLYLDTIAPQAIKDLGLSKTAGAYFHSERYPLKNGEKLKEIPFFPITSKGISWELERAPMDGIVNLNLVHYRDSALYEQSITLTASPTTILSGYLGDDKKPIVLGGSNCLLVSESGAASYLEYTGTGLGDMREALEIKKAEMAVLGVRILAGEAGSNVSAESASIEQAGEQAVLANIANSISSAFTKAVRVMSTWDDYDKKLKPKDYEQIIVTLNTDFTPNTLNANTLNALTVMLKSGLLSDEEMFNILKRGEILPADMTFAEHNKQLNASLFYNMLYNDIGSSNQEINSTATLKDDSSKIVDYRRVTNPEDVGNANAGEGKENLPTDPGGNPKNNQ